MYYKRWHSYLVLGVKCLLGLYSYNSVHKKNVSSLLVFAHFVGVRGYSSHQRIGVCNEQLPTSELACMYHLSLDLASNWKQWCLLGKAEQGVADTISLLTNVFFGVGACKQFISY